MKKTLQDLLDGYQQFYSRQKELTENITSMAGVQKPSAMVITCCDSRIELGSLFNVAPGELFIVRNVANIIPLPEQNHTSHGVSAALEFAVKFLHIKHIIIMGHSNCGGIAALCDHNEKTEYIGSWVEHIRENYETLAPQYDKKADLLCALEKQNVVLGLQRLQKFSWIKEALSHGKLEIHGWYFDFKTAGLSAYKDGMFTSLNTYKENTL